MNTITIPNDLAAIARARGLSLTAKAGAFIVRDARRLRLTTCDVEKLRAWLSGVQSVMTEKAA